MTTQEAIYRIGYADAANGRPASKDMAEQWAIYREGYHDGSISINSERKTK